MQLVGKVTLILAILAVGCNAAPIKQQKMVNIMTDAMIMEAGNQLKYNGGLLPHGKWMQDYAVIAQKNGVDTNDLKKAFDYYIQNPKAYSKVMEKVITNLQEQQLNINK